jgi:hypothetical protein
MCLKFGQIMDGAAANLCRDALCAFLPVWQLLCSARLASHNVGTMALRCMAVPSDETCAAICVACRQCRRLSTAEVAHSAGMHARTEH